jgi:hypothetical protein
LKLGERNTYADSAITGECGELGGHTLESGGEVVGVECGGEVERVECGGEGVGGGRSVVVAGLWLNFEGRVLVVAGLWLNVEGRVLVVAGQVLELWLRGEGKVLVVWLV